jgi:energy-coupling factor transporter ATP-binding protein EcfA2
MFSKSTMNQNRDLHIASLIVGRKGTGKSTLLAGMATGYPPDKKVLVLDVNGSAAYANFPEIKPKDIRGFIRPGKAKLSGTPTKETLTDIAKYFKNGLVVFEDCTKYIPAYPQPEIKTFLVDHRMSGCDLVFTFHSLKMVPPLFWQMVSYVVILKTLEQFESARNKQLVPNYNEVLAAFNRVNQHKDNYYNETVATFV